MLVLVLLFLLWYICLSKPVHVVWFTGWPNSWIFGNLSG